MQGRVIQNGMTVVSVAGLPSEVYRELRHYGMMYEQDGPVKLQLRAENSRYYTEWKDWK